MLNADERVVVLATGSGLKDVATAMRSAGEAQVIAPDIADVRRHVSRFIRGSN
jgi:threonine synthase